MKMIFNPGLAKSPVLALTFAVLAAANAHAAEIKAVTSGGFTDCLSGTCSRI